MKRLKYLIILVLAGHSALMAQQLPHFSQYMFNDYILNPAHGGTDDYYQVKTNYRYQWAGIKDAPQTYILSAYGPHKTMPMGYGGYLFSDNTGPTKFLGIYGSYAYNIRLTGNIRLSSGLFLGLKQYKIDFTRINFSGDSGNQTDPAEANGDKYTKIVPDATIGVLAYTSQWWGGISAHQLIPSKIEPVDSVNIPKKLQRLKGHYYINGGYRYNINRDLDIIGSALIKYAYPVLPQLDLSARVIWQKMAWGGLSFRTSDAIAVLMGYNYQDKILIGYSYDLTFSHLRKYSSGSHEIMIGVKFNRIKQSKSTRRVR